jgi:hypothetical protein
MGPVNPSKNFLNFYDYVVYTLKTKARNKNKFKERTFLILKKRTNPGTISRGDGIFFQGAPKNKENSKKTKGH